MLNSLERVLTSISGVLNLIYNDKPQHLTPRAIEANRGLLFALKPVALGPDNPANVDILATVTAVKNISAWA